MSLISSSCYAIDHCSNLENFLRLVTPIIKHPSLHADDSNQVQETNRLEKAHTKLQDIWEIYDEWSCCGVGIPIVLESGERVVQYYVPYLSAIQIFIKSSTTTSYDDDDDDGGASTKSNDKNLCDRHLYVQFFESCSPYLRVPFLDKVMELAQSYPGLLTFHVNDISSASWMSVAWYPIYHIPASISSTKDLCTCFLTFHTLSCYFQDNDEEEGDKSEQVSYLVPFGLATYKMQGDVWNNRDKGDDEKIKDLENAASSWLKQLHVHHHDFIFFTQ